MKNTTLVICDIQPDYGYLIPFKNEFIKFLNDNYRKYSQVIYFYNTNDMYQCTEEKLFDWLKLNKVKRNVLKKVKFSPKEYEFWISAVDDGFSANEIIQAGKELIKYKKNSNKEIPIFYDNVIDILGEINTPEIELMGGCYDRCLKELELVLQSLEKQYTLNHKFIF